MSKNQVLTNALAIDCEMVEAAAKSPHRLVNMVARVSLVNEYGKCVYDTYVKPTKQVTDYRTQWSGVQPHHVARGLLFQNVKTEVAILIRGRLLIGHSLDEDLRVLGLGHPKRNKRDTEVYFRTNGDPPSLKYLAVKYLGWDIQNGAHSSVKDARAAMRIYKKVEDEWEEFCRHECIESEVESSKEEGENENESSEEEEESSATLTILQDPMLIDNKYFYLLCVIFNYEKLISGMPLLGCENLMRDAINLYQIQRNCETNTLQQK